MRAKIKFERITSEDEKNIKEFSPEKAATALRQLRERECFETVNRGEAWYELLTDGQKEELKAWYASWLDVTKTLEIPKKPEWLK